MSNDAPSQAQEHRRSSPDSWLRSGQYLPDFMRDFHDQKDVFKALQEVVERRNERDGKLSYTADVTWIAAHVYTVDVFLWVMAKHGYTLQRSRKPLAFPSISAFIGAAKERWQADAAAALHSVFASAGKDGSSPQKDPTP
jgi:hypothetical protein